MTDPIRAALQRLVAADQFIGEAGPEYQQARDAARAALAAAPEGEAMQRLLAAPIDARWYADLSRPAAPPAVTDEPADAEGGLLPREAFADRAMREGRENWLAGPRGVITLPGAAAAPVAPPAPAPAEEVGP